MPENEYHERNMILRRMGYFSYDEYLKSDLWEHIRSIVMEMYSSKCRLCIAKATLVHHLTYAERVLKGEDPTGLIPLCSKCHYKVEFDSNSIKRDIHQARDRYYELKKKGKGEPAVCPVCKNKREWGGCQIWCKKFRNPEYVPNKKALRKEGLCECGNKKSSMKHPRCRKCQTKFVKEIIANKKAKGKKVF